MAIFEGDNADGEKDPLDYPIASGSVVTVWIGEDDDEKAYLSVKVDAKLLGQASYYVRPTDRAGDFLNKMRDAWAEWIRDLEKPEEENVKKVEE